MKRALMVVLILAALGWLGWRLFRPPDPAEILARIEVPPSPVLSAQDELASFRLAPGFRAELVAAEPMVVDPVAMDWDDRGRLFVVEMRGYMRDLDASDEDQPSGRVVVLEDLDRDGRMDRSQVFLDGLVLPRAIAVLPEGVLIGAPPDLILCRDANEDLVCTASERTRLLGYATEPGNVEHRENALLPGLDGWIYNSKSARRFRLGSPDANAQTRSEISATVDQSVFRGQWGLSQDDEGRLYYNHNSGFLYADLFPADYLMRQPATAASLTKIGVGVDLAPGEQVFGVRVAPGLNRAMQPGSLRRDGRQAAPTGVSGLVIQRGDQYGPEYVGDAFVPESAGAVVAHFSIEAEDDGLELEAAHALYPDQDYGEREFLAATDERFRPVDAKIGPDGTVWIIDMYRGVIQHAYYVSDYLRSYIQEHDLAPPGATGRIWRIVREDRPIEYEPPPLARLEQQLAALDHPNGWVRDRAQRRLIASDDPAAPLALRRLDDFSALGQRHALRALASRGELDLASWRAGIESPSAEVRSLALQVGESMLPGEHEAIRTGALRLVDDEDRSVRIQALHTLGSLAPEHRPLAKLLGVARNGDPAERQAVLSGLDGLEFRALDQTLADSPSSDPDWIQAVASAAYMHAQTRPDRAALTAGLLDRVAAWSDRDEEIALALLEGIALAQELPGAERVVLAAEHELLAPPDANRGETLGDALLRIRQGLTWEGDPSPGGARPLDDEEERLRVQGVELYASTCAGCHGAQGRGADGLAPPLAGSAWVRNADEWLIRIALQGLHGPIEVLGQTWNLSMPGHAHDPRFDDRALAGLLTHLRRAWGHGDEPVRPETVTRVRAETRDRRTAWTAEELLALPIEHRLDRFTGTYRVPIIGIELVVARDGNVLEVGRSKGGKAPMIELGNGLFTGEGIRMRFDLTQPGRAETARIQFGSDSVEVSRVES